MTEALSDAERSMLLAELAKRPQRQLEVFTGEGHEVSPSCGDEVWVQVLVTASEIQEFGIRGHGCTVSMAALAALAEVAPCGIPEFSALAERYLASVAVDGMPVDEYDLDAFAGIGRFPLRARCATIAWRAALAAVDASDFEATPPAS